MRYPGTKLNGDGGAQWGGGYGTSKIVPFRRAKMVVKCTSAGQFTGQRTIGYLLLQKKGHRQKCLTGQPLTSPRKFCEVTSLEISGDATHLAL